MKTRNLFCLALLLPAISYSQKQTDSGEIRSKLKQLYTLEESFYGMKANVALFSKDLLNRIYNSWEVTRLDEERIKNSDMPTDKPLLIEGSVFSGLYDGYSRYRIGKITVDAKKAKAHILFELAGEPKESWTDTVQLVRENGWKIDNVLFSSKVSTLKDLKEKLDLKNE